jgi:hypothetical protein
MTNLIMDAPNALGFVINQQTHIETQVLKKPYPAIRYAELIPIDTSATPFAASITHFSQDYTGRAKFINGKGDDIPLANITGTKYELTVNTAGIGYSFSLEEIGRAAQLGMNLSTEGAASARLAYEQLVDEVAFVGDTTLGIEGLYNTTGISSAAAAQAFSAATPAQILVTVNTAINAVFSSTNGIELPDTIVLPITQFADIASRAMGPEGMMTVLDFIQRKNVYTVQTGQPLRIVADRRLSNRMVVYRRDDTVLKMHMPMPLRFIAPQMVNLEVKVLGMFRFAPISIRRPGAMRYVTGI